MTSDEREARERAQADRIALTHCPRCHTPVTNANKARPLEVRCQRCEAELIRDAIDTPWRLRTDLPQMPWRQEG